MRVNNRHAVQGNNRLVDVRDADDRLRVQLARITRDRVGPVGTEHQFGNVKRRRHVHARAAGKLFEVRKLVAIPPTRIAHFYIIPHRDRHPHRVRILPADPLFNVVRIGIVRDALRVFFIIKNIRLQNIHHQKDLPSPVPVRGQRQVQHRVAVALAQHIDVRGVAGQGIAQPPGVGIFRPVERRQHRNQAIALARPHQPVVVERSRVEREHQPAALADVVERRIEPHALQIIQREYRLVHQAARKLAVARQVPRPRRADRRRVHDGGKDLPRDQRGVRPRLGERVEVGRVDMPVALLPDTIDQLAHRIVERALDVIPSEEFPQVNELQFARVAPCSVHADVGLAQAAERHRAEIDGDERAGADAGADGAAGIDQRGRGRRAAPSDGASHGLRLNGLGRLLAGAARRGTNGDDDG